MIHMEIALINSLQDPAGVNIRRHLRELLGNPAGDIVEHGLHRYTFREVDGRLIHQEGIDRHLQVDLIIFISRHTSIQPTPTLTVHVTGNIGSAELGGDPRSLAMASPEWMHAILGNLSRYATPGYRVSYEVTHHGPTDIGIASLFVEIGSTEVEWKDPDAGLAVARSILEAEPGKTINLIGFGGNHYAARQTDIALSNRVAWGHIAHTREVEDIDAEMIRQMQKKSDAVAAYIDRKSIPKRVLRQLEILLDRLGILRLTETELREIGSIDWDTYLEVRSLAVRIAPGARCHFHSISGSGRPIAFSIDEKLLEEALKIGGAKFMGKLDKLSIVHLSSPDGQILPIFISYEENRSEQIHDLISSCVKIIMISENTAVEEDRLILRRTRFDPGLANKQGVPQGPLFGRLAAGKEISINGKVITPAMVSVCSERVIHVPGLEKYV
jgi:D-aminoacyl-tRNA deacylase